MKAFAARSLVLLTMILVASNARSDDAKTAKAVDPSGTWRWEHKEGGETIKDVLELNFDGQKVTGTYKGRRGPVEIANGKMDGDKLSCDFSLEFGDQTIKIAFAGKIKDDKVVGTVGISGGGQDAEFPWKAERSLHASDVVGEWKLKIPLNDGNTLTPTLMLTQEGDKKELQGRYVGGNDGQFKVDAKDLRVKDNKLLFTISGEFNDNSLTAHYATQPRGDKLTGKIEYKFNDQTGELTVEGVRKKEERQDKEESVPKKEDSASTLPLSNGVTAKQIVQSLDKDDDGSISKVEASEDLKLFFDQYDANRDGKIDVKESQAIANYVNKRQPAAATPAKPATPGKVTAKQIVAFMDKNDDGKISEDEASAELKLNFQFIDTNGDGVIDLKEAQVMADFANKKGQ